MDLNTDLGAAGVDTLVRLCKMGGDPDFFAEPCECQIVLESPMIGDEGLDTLT